MSTVTLEQALQAAVACHQQGRWAEAEALYRRILAAQPKNPDALHLLGVLAHQVGQHDAAVELITRAIAQKADESVFYSNLGEAYRALGRLDEAIACYKQALTIQPDYPDAHNNLADVLSSLGRVDEALTAYKSALQLNPDHAEAHNNLGNAYSSQDQVEEAVLSYKRALEIKPDFAQAHYNLGNAWKEQGRLDEAHDAYNRALEIAPSLAEAHSNLGNVFKDQGRVEEAIACYRRAVALAPDNSLIHSSLLFTLHLHPATDATALLTEHRAWAQRHEPSRRRFQRPLANPPEPDRRPLKIGYVSPDLRKHPVGRILLPLLANHDHKNFVITCYADVAKPDDLTEQLRALSDHWRETSGLSEEQLAEQIHQDGIDILVDLSLHTAGRQLLVFARKPAPVQATWLGYCSTSGLDAMDYRLTDPYQEPPGPSEDYYSETVIPLPETFWCYPAPEGAPAVTSLPALANEFITFGCLNNFYKVNARILTVWAQILRALPNSRLVLHTGEGSHREWVRQTLAEEGLDPARLSFVGQVSLTEYFRSHAKIDIALDSSPYPGGTTTCDALWMGVPVVSLVGQTAVGRGGLSILSNIGLPELAARTEDKYVNIALELANDLPRLAHLRETMRKRMQASPLMDAPRFAKNIEHAYRTLWKKWCRDRTESRPQP